MNSMEKIKQALENNPALEEKFKAEIQRIAEDNTITDKAAALIAAAKTVLGVDLTDVSQENFGELADEELDQVSGGYGILLLLQLGRNSPLSSVFGKLREDAQQVPSVAASYLQGAEKLFNKRKG